MSILDIICSKFIDKIIVYYNAKKNAYMLLGRTLLSEPFSFFIQLFTEDGSNHFLLSVKEQKGKGLLLWNSLSLIFCNRNSL